MRVWRMSLRRLKSAIISWAGSIERSPGCTMIKDHNHLPAPWGCVVPLLVPSANCKVAKFEPPHEKTNKMTCAPSEDSDQPGDWIVWSRFNTAKYIPMISSILQQWFSEMFVNCKITKEPPHDKTNKMTCAPNKDSDQPGHPPSLIRVFTVRSIGS